MATSAQQAAFLKMIIPLAIADMRTSKVPASLTIAQAILESGWGLSGLTNVSNNLFGIKGKYNGDSVMYQTFEYVNGRRVSIVDEFRKYPSWAESLSDHSSLFTRLPRYSNIPGCTDYRIACRNVQADGYATAPTYADSLISIIEAHKLYQYDAKAVKYRVIFPYISTKSECETIKKWVQAKAKYTAIIEEEK